MINEEMNDKEGSGERSKKVSGFRQFFSESGLPLFLISATVVYEAFLLAIVFAPIEGTIWGRFAVEFKQWCFSYNPRTGGMEWASVIVMLIEPLFIAIIAGFLWRSSLLRLFRERLWAKQWKPIGAGVFAALLAISGLFLTGKPGAEAERFFPFPGERIRVALTPPDFQLEDQKGVLFSLNDVKGELVLVTGVYAACATSCPDILTKTMSLVESLPEEISRRTSIVALSLNPEYDTRDLMNRVAEGYGFSYPQFRYINGEPEVMNLLLQRFGFSRSVDPDTGVVDHANLFLFVDAAGKIAYRLTLDDRHGDWLREAALALGSELKS